MLKNLFKIVFICLLFTLILTVFLPAVSAQTLTAEGLLAGKSGETGVAFIIGRFIKVALAIVGAVALIVFIYGGFMWLTSAGISDKIQKGKTIIVWAIIGLIIVLMSYVLTDFVIYALTLGSSPLKPPVTTTPPPVGPPPPISTACISGAAKDANGCCEKFPAFSDASACTQALTGGLYRCCDCGNTIESQGFVCREGPKRNCVLQKTETIDGAAVKFYTCDLKDGNFTVIEGHCGKQDWWCSVVK